MDEFNRNNSWFWVRKDVLRRECGWLGFGPLSANVLAHPAPDESDLEMTLKQVGAAEDVVVMSAQTLGSDAPMRKLAATAWNLDDIDTRYQKFVTMFRPLFNALKKRPVASRLARHGGLPALPEPIPGPSPGS